MVYNVSVCSAINTETQTQQMHFFEKCQADTVYSRVKHKLLDSIYSSSQFSARLQQTFIVYPVYLLLLSDMSPQLGSQASSLWALKHDPF